VPVVIEVSGPSAVGKTTMISALAPAIGAVAVPEVLQSTTYRLPKPASAGGFLDNQAWLLEQVSATYVRARGPGASVPLPGNDPVSPPAYLVDSGLADVFSFAKHSPRVRGSDWDITESLARVALGLERRLGIDLGPDLILYLAASPSTVRARREADPVTSRRDHDENSLLIPYEEAYFRRLAELHPDVVAVINAEAGPAEVLEEALAAVKRRLEAARGSGDAGSASGHAGQTPGNAGRTPEMKARLGLVDLLRPLGWEGEEVAPLPMTDRLMAHLEGAVESIRATLRRLGPVRLSEILRHVSLSDKEVLAVLEREVAVRAMATDGRNYWLTAGADEPAPLHGRLAAALFNPHYAAALAGSTLASLRERLARFLDDRPPPAAGYDQRHVTPRTALLRALYLLHRGDLAGRRVILLGDDDLTSLALALVGGAAGLTVLEIDERLVAFLDRRLAEIDVPDARVLLYDAGQELPDDLLGVADTFLCDPSRPLYDLFLQRGKEALRPGGALYTFVYPSHSLIGPDHDFLRRAMEKDLTLTDLLPSFSEYQRYLASLPVEFAGRYPAGDSPDETICFTESLARFARG
jgi:hypothetical protein